MGSSELTDDAIEGLRGIGGVADGTSNDEPIAPGGDGFGRAKDALLIAEITSAGTDARRDQAETCAEFLAETWHF